MRTEGPTRMTLAIACASGGFKGVFVHGVLSAFEEAGLNVEAYAASPLLAVRLAVPVRALASINRACQPPVITAWPEAPTVSEWLPSVPSSQLSPRPHLDTVLSRAEWRN